MRKARLLPKPRKIRRPIFKPADETPNLGPIESDFEAEYQAFIQELRSKKEQDEEPPKEDSPQDIQPD